MALALLAGLLIASSTPETLTKEEALAMTTPNLARRVLGMAGAGLHENRVFGGGMPGDSPGRLATIAFTAGATTAGWRSLCHAAVTSVRFYPARSDDRAIDPMSIACGIDTYPMWSVLPSYRDDADKDFVSGFRRDHLACIAQGAVLSDRTHFFRATWSGQRDLGPSEATFVAGIVRVLDKPVSSVRAVVRCEDQQVAGCPDAAAALARIDTLIPGRAEVALCQKDVTRLCLAFEYEQQGDPRAEGRYTAVLVETDAATTFDDTPAILSVTLQRRGWVV